MTDGIQRRSVGSLPEIQPPSAAIPAALTRLVWALWIGTLVVVAGFVRNDAGWTAEGLLAIDGLTVVMWTVVTFFSGIVHSYARRYLAGNPGQTAFFTRVFAFTLTVMVVVAANHIALFAAAWLAMGLLMAELIGHVDGWPQAQAAARTARRYFVGSSVLIAASLAVLWSATDATTITGMLDVVGGVPTTTAVLAAAGLVVAAMIQSALIPFHTWILSSMTAPTPASALMHAGFVNAGGVLLARFAPVVTVVGGALFAVLTGKGTIINGGLLLTFFVTFATLHAARSTVQHTNLSATLRYGAVPLVFFPAIIVYAAVYEAVSFMLADLPVVTASTELTLLHGAIAVVFVGTYLAIETGIHEDSGRLYVALLNLTQPVSDSLLTTTEDYNEY